MPAPRCRERMPGRNRKARRGSLLDLRVAVLDDLGLFDLVGLAAGCRKARKEMAGTARREPDGAPRTGRPFQEGR